MKRASFLVLATFFLLVVIGAALAALPPGGTFLDDDGNIHEGSIEAIAAAGITRGCNPPVNDLYCPSDPVNRGQMAAFLTRALGLTERLDNPFTDDDGSVFEADIERMAAAGITRGCNPPANDLFCPDAYVTRGQMAAFLVRALGYTDAGLGDLFTDDNDSVFEADIDRLGTAGVTKGCNPPVNDEFCPNSPVSRDQMASFLTRALNLTPITPPPPDSTTTTTVPVTTTTLPEVGPSATFTACGDDTVGHEFSLREPCIAATVYQAGWATGQAGVISYRWLDPDGQPVSSCPVSGSCTTVEYHYIGSQPTGWTFYFYVDGETRDPGWHSLEMWSGTTADKLQTLLLRDNFKLSDIDPVPPPQARPTVSWECTTNPDGTRTCTGNTDTLDPAAETWTCNPVPDEYEQTDWDCVGDIDKRKSGNESWFCNSYGTCTGDVDTSDAADETWKNIWSSSYSVGEGDIDKSDPGDEKWRCDDTATGLSCSADWQPWEWVCIGDYRADWTCSGSVGRLAPIVGPVPSDENAW
jgi:hypothetical protein